MNESLTYQKTNARITRLAPNEVFVFGSNAGGFHGAGSAGQAMRGESSNNWRNDQKFLKAMRASAGHPERIGKWAVYGVARGHQIGTEGQSYAIETIVRPAERRSTPLLEIQKQLEALLAFATAHENLKILMTPVGCGYSGYSTREMRKVWEDAMKSHGSLPANVKNTDALYLPEGATLSQP